MRRSEGNGIFLISQLGKGIYMRVVTNGERESLYVRLRTRHLFEIRFKKSEKINFFTLEETPKDRMQICSNCCTKKLLFMNENVATIAKENWEQKEVFCWLLWRLFKQLVNNSTNVITIQTHHHFHKYHRHSQKNQSSKLPQIQTEKYFWKNYDFFFVRLVGTFLLSFCA